MTPPHHDPPQHTVDLVDFARPDPQEEGRWRFLPDRVMGGVSRGSAVVDVVEGRRALHLTGHVSLDRGGGFIQVVRGLGEGERRPLDASGYRGLGAEVRGRSGKYFLHLRTGDTRAPWQYYGAPLTVEAEWRLVELTWSDFVPISIGRPLDVSRLMRIGLVAAWEAFRADVALARLTLLPRRS